MRNPRTGGAGVPESVSTQLDDAQDTADTTRITRLPVRSLTAAQDHLDRRGLCACWIAPHSRHCKGRWSR